MGSSLGLQSCSCSGLISEKTRPRSGRIAVVASAVSPAGVGAAMSLWSNAGEECGKISGAARNSAKGPAVLV